ncbi:chalcone--flavonone isomerase-like isoform X2 [Punica granatum]|uniref:Chalcone-flavonone isomerase family protein n=1 Tax=Punica granatum TaxID=22663 RepID=A0A6P8BNQ4_PUNGR|nr:chalcone--flavonone isomerase-like isoform X2 [Punica granatum]
MFQVLTIMRVLFILSLWIHLATAQTTTVVTGVQVENFSFPPAAKPPGSDKTLFLGGAGVRGLDVDGKFVKYTAIGVYLEEKALPLLATEWKGKSAEELTDTDEFFRDIITGPFEKLTQVSFITQLTGKQYSDKVAENCIAFWKSIGAYGASEARAIDWFLDVFKDQSFPPGSSIFFTHLSNGSYVISFSKHESIPEVGNAVIENNELAEAVLETIIGNGGVSPAARKSLATRLAEFMKLEKIDF